MKNIIFTVIILLLTIQVLPQSKKNSLSLNVGILVPTGDLSDLYDRGFNLGLDFQKYKFPFSYFAEFNSNFFKTKNEYLSNDANYKEIIELNAGPRLFLMSEQPYPFLDVGFGAYYTNVTNSSVRVGFNAGIGAIIEMDDDFDLILKAKYHSYYAGGDDGSFINYIGIYGGLKYNF